MSLTRSTNTTMINIKDIELRERIIEYFYYNNLFPDSPCTCLSLDHDNHVRPLIDTINHDTSKLRRERK